MPDIRTEGGKLLETARLPGEVEPMFCCDCGGRIGWYDSEYGAPPVAWCDDCAADLAD